MALKNEMAINQYVLPFYTRGYILFPCGNNAHVRCAAGGHSARQRREAESHTLGRHRQALCHFNNALIAESFTSYGRDA